MKPSAAGASSPRACGGLTALTCVVFLAAQLLVLTTLRPANKLLAANPRPQTLAGPLAPGPSPSAIPAPPAAGPVVVVRLGPLLSANTATAYTLGGAGLAGPEIVQGADPNRWTMYVAAHNGKAIAVLQAQNISGPWTLSHSETISKSTIDTPESLCGCPTCGHVAAPNIVRFNETHERIVLHCLRAQLETSGPVANQPSFWTSRKVGAQPNAWTAGSHIRGLPFYAKLFNFRGHWYALAKQERVEKGQQEGGLIFKLNSDWSAAEQGGLLVPRMRHATVMVYDESALLIIFSRTGDRPEHLLFAVARLDSPGVSWQNWTLSSPPSALLAPFGPLEGSFFSRSPSSSGQAKPWRRELRDPSIFLSDNSSDLYLVYVAAGERRIFLSVIPEWRTQLLLRNSTETCTMEHCLDLTTAKEIAALGKSSRQEEVGRP